MNMSKIEFFSQGVAKNAASVHAWNIYMPARLLDAVGSVLFPAVVIQKVNFWEIWPNLQ